MFTCINIPKLWEVLPKPTTVITHDWALWLGELGR